MLRTFTVSDISSLHIHTLNSDPGTSGIDGTDLLPKPTSPPITGTDAILAMRTALFAQPKGEAWLVATGALTNVAQLFILCPDLPEHIKGLSIMGGAIGDGFSPVTKKDSQEPFGNTTFYAEFNIYVRTQCLGSLWLGADAKQSRSVTQKPQM